MSTPPQINDKISFMSPLMPRIAVFALAMVLNAGFRLAIVIVISLHGVDIVGRIGAFANPDGTRSVKWARKKKMK